MRLVIDGRRLTKTRTGVGRYLEILLEEWADTDFPAVKNLLALTDPDSPILANSVSPLNAQILHPRRPGLLWEWFGLGRVLRSGDVLFAPGNLVPANWRGPTVLTLHDVLQEVRPQDFPRQVRWRFGWRYRSATRRADRILVPSQTTAQDASRIYKIAPGRIRVIPPAPGRAFYALSPDAEQARSARGAIAGLADRPFFLFVGKRSRRRHVTELIEAFRRFHQQRNEFRLVLVGPGQSKDLPPAILQAGHVPDAILCGLMAGAVALFYPSEYEGFGLPVVEAMASGCPVVTLRNGALAEVGGDAPLYLDRPDPDHLMDAMRHLSTDASARSEHIARGLSQAAHFRADVFADAVRRELRAFLDPS